jgi:hypothetical protein
MKKNIKKLIIKKLLIKKSVVIPLIKRKFIKKSVVIPFIKKPFIKKPFIKKPFIKKSLIKKKLINKSVVISLIKKPLIKKLFVKPSIKQVLKPLIKKQVVKTLIKKSVLKPLIKKQVVKPLLKKSVLKPLIKKPVVKPLIKKFPVIPLIKNPLINKSLIKRQIIKKNESINNFSIKKNTDIIISINVYKNFNFLENQLENIKTYVKSDYCVILNCNDFMYNELKKNSLPENIYINPEIINKYRFHGSILKGIVTNMYYAYNNFNFKYFVVLSARTIFYRDIDITNLDVLYEKFNSLEEYNKYINIKNNLLEWRWPSIKNTLLAKYYLNLNFYIRHGAHEGICFNIYVIKNILLFFNKNENIKNNLYNFNNCVEEFALQTISHNEINHDNMYFGFIDLGNGISLDIDINNKDKYTKKINF